MPRLPKSGSVRKTFALSEFIADLLEGMAAVSGKDQSAIVEAALLQGPSVIENMGCFAGEIGDHAIAELIEKYQARELSLNAGRTEMFCELILEMLDEDLIKFKFLSLRTGVDWYYDKLESVNEYIANRLPDRVCAIEDAPFAQLKALAEKKKFISKSAKVTKENFTTFVRALHRYAVVDCVEREAFLLRILVVMLRDVAYPVTDEIQRRRIYQLAKKHGVELL